MRSLYNKQIKLLLLCDLLIILFCCGINWGYVDNVKFTPQISEVIINHPVKSYEIARKITLLGMNNLSSN